MRVPRPFPLLPALAMTHHARLGSLAEDALGAADVVVRVAPVAQVEPLHRVLGRVAVLLV